MGSSSYSGKGSSSYSSYREPVKKPVKIEKSPMDEVFKLMAVTEQNRRIFNQRKEDVSSAKRELAMAEKELKRSEQQVMVQLERLDPETRNSLRRMMEGVNRTDGNIIER